MGLLWESKLLIEYFIRLKTFIKRNPELVEKNDPPIMTKIKNIKVRFDGTFSNEIPRLETLLDIETSIFKKSLS